MDLPTNGPINGSSNPLKLLIKGFHFKTMMKRKIWSSFVCQKRKERTTEGRRKRLCEAFDSSTDGNANTYTKMQKCRRTPYAHKHAIKS